MYGPEDEFFFLADEGCSLNLSYCTLLLTSNYLGEDFYTNRLDSSSTDAGRSCSNFWRSGSNLRNVLSLDFMILTTSSTTIDQPLRRGYYW